MDYETNRQMLVERMNQNLILAKVEIDKKMTNSIQMVSCALEMVDGTYFQEQNDVNNISFAGLSTPVSCDEIAIQPSVCEPNSQTHSFRIRPECFITGHLSLISGEKAYGMFNIKPFSTDTLSHASEFNLVAVSNCDSTPNTLMINVKLDSKKRISKIQIPNINFKEFPGVRSEFVNVLMGRMDLINAEDVRSFSNSLAFKYAMANVPSSKNLSESDEP